MEVIVLLWGFSGVFYHFIPWLCVGLFRAWLYWSEPVSLGLWTQLKIILHFYMREYHWLIECISKVLPSQAKLSVWVRHQGRHRCCIKVEKMFVIPTVAWSSSVPHDTQATQTRQMLVSGCLESTFPIHTLHTAPSVGALLFSAVCVGFYSTLTPCF